MKEGLYPAVKVFPNARGSILLRCFVSKIVAFSFAHLLSCFVPFVPRLSKRPNLRVSTKRRPPKIRLAKHKTLKIGSVAHKECRVRLHGTDREQLIRGEGTGILSGLGFVDFMRFSTNLTALKVCRI